MNDDYTTLEQSKRLAALGYIGARPRMGWMRHKMEPASGLVWLAHPPAGPSAPLWEWYPAPTLLRALQWLREQYGWYWSYSYDSWHAESAEPFTAPMNASSPSDLIDAILDKLEDRND